MRTLFFALLLSGMTVLPWQTDAAAAESVARMDNVTWFRLRFGMGVGMNRVTRDRFDAFIEAEVAPRFPKGFTMSWAKARWSSPENGSIVNEDAIVIDVETHYDTVAKAMVDAIAKTYVETFAEANASCQVRTVPAATIELHYVPR
jgi:Protein of unknown function (DUF3574).